MMFSHIIGVFVLVAVVVAHPPVKKNGYSIVTHHVEPKKVPQSEWAKPAAQSSWNQGSYGKAASSFSSLSIGSKHAPAFRAPLKPLAWSKPAGGYAQQHSHDAKSTYPKYKFDYGVSDPHTGDNKKQWETRDGDVVKGAYQVNDAKNGAKRLVEYKSDKHGGLQADVKSKIVKPQSSW